MKDGYLVSCDAADRRFRGVAIIVTLALILVFNTIALADLRDMEGKIRSLDDYIGKGKWTVVMIWASDCPVCNAEVHQYVLFHDDHMDKDATVLGISLDGQAKRTEALEFIDRHFVDFPNLIGEPESVAALYARLTGRALIGTPTFLIFSPEGNLLVLQVGPVSTERILEFISAESR